MPSAPPSTRQAVFLGLDLTNSPARASAYAVLDSHVRVCALGYLRQDAEILACILDVKPTVVAVDAPLGLPQGMCCLEEGCPCSPTSQRKGRACEQGLARLGIGCFYTTKRSIIKGMVYRGIALRRALEARGVAVLEVFPYASKVLLLGRDIPKKSTPQGRAFLTSWLCQAVQGLDGLSRPLTHDQCDAIVAAYTALLRHLGKTTALGVPGEGQITVPALGQHPGRA
ncbi:MAG: DUF429 domain-containing protein [Chloroflexi bacterium]|nr:DUF429 domain-containing protein [Chloroflexota bacterium]